MGISGAALERSCRISRVNQTPLPCWERMGEGSAISMPWMFQFLNSGWSGVQSSSNPSLQRTGIGGFSVELPQSCTSMVIHEDRNE